MARLDIEEMRMINPFQVGLVRPNRFVTVKRLHELTGLPLGTIYDWNNRGRLRATTFDDESSRILVDLEHFNAVLDSRLREEAAYEENMTNEQQQEMETR